MSTLNNKVILVTGASRGIGAEVAQRLAAAGAKVIVNYAGGKDAADQVVSSIKSMEVMPLLCRLMSARLKKWLHFLMPRLIITERLTY